MAQRPGPRALSSQLDSVHAFGFMGITNLSSLATVLAPLVIGITGTVRVREVWSLRNGTVKTYPLLTFDHDKTINRDANGRIATLTITDGVNTKTYTITRDVNGRITAINESWV